MELRIKKESETKPLKNNNEESNIHKDHRQRLKSQFIKNGIDSLTDVQKLELLLFYAIPQKDTNPIAHKLLKEFGSLSRVISADISELVEVDGIKENSATLIKFFGEMLNYTSRPESTEIINSSKSGKDYVTRYFQHLAVEKFYLFCITKSGTVKNSFLINTGTEGEVNVNIRKITKHILETKCNKIIVAHNHPNGKAIMSDQDCRFTYSLICSCILNEIELYDHIIVGTDKTISLYEQGIISKLIKKASETIQLSPEKKLFISQEPVLYTKSMIDE